MNHERTQLDNEAGSDREIEIEREVERRVRLREKEMRERTLQASMNNSAKGMYVVLGMIAFMYSNHFFPEITRIAIIAIICGAAAAGFVLVICNLCKHKRITKKSKLGALGAFLGAVVISMPIANNIGMTYWPEETKAVLIAVLYFFVVLLSVVLLWGAFEKLRAKYQARRISPN